MTLLPRTTGNHGREPVEDCVSSTRKDQTKHHSRMAVVRGSRIVGSISAIATSFFVPAIASAQVAGAIRAGLTNAAKPAGYLGGETNPVVIIGNVLNTLLGFMGIALVLYLLYGGFVYMTAGGDSKKVDSAKDTIKHAVIGMIIIVAAFAITAFVLDQLANAFGAGGAAVVPGSAGTGGPAPPPATPGP